MSEKISNQGLFLAFFFAFFFFLSHGAAAKLILNLVDKTQGNFI